MFRKTLQSRDYNTERTQTRYECSGINNVNKMKETKDSGVGIKVCNDYNSVYISLLAPRMICINIL